MFLETGHRIKMDFAKHSDVCDRDYIVLAEKWSGILFRLFFNKNWIIWRIAATPTLPGTWCLSSPLNLAPPPPPHPHLSPCNNVNNEQTDFRGSWVHNPYLLFSFLRFFLPLQLDPLLHFSVESQRCLLVQVWVRGSARLCHHFAGILRTQTCRH